MACWTRKDQLLGLIKDAYARMATNRDFTYRAVQTKKVDDWLEELTKIYETDQEQWMACAGIGM